MSKFNKISPFHPLLTSLVYSVTPPWDHDWHKTIPVLQLEHLLNDWNLHMVLHCMFCFRTRLCPNPECFTLNHRKTWFEPIIQPLAVYRRHLCQGTAGQVFIITYSGPSLKGHTREDPPPLERTQILGSKYYESMCCSLSHQRTPL